MESDRYKRGWEKLKELDGHAGERVIEALKDRAPDLARYTIEFPFGDVYSRGIRSLKEREIATVAALAALGNAQPQLKVHIHGALNVGCTRQEVVEIMIQMAVYAGVSRRIEWHLCSQRGVCGARRRGSVKLISPNLAGLVRSPQCCHCEERSDAAISFFQTVTNYEIASLRSQRRLIGLFTNESTLPCVQAGRSKSAASLNFTLKL